MKNYLFSKLFACFVMVLPMFSYGATAALTGKCVLTLNFSLKGRVIEHGIGLNSMGIIDFDKKEFSITTNQYDDSQPKKSKLNHIRGAFILKDGFLDGSFLIHSDHPAATFDLQIFPVNSNNTFLVQAVNLDSLGVCQKI